MAEKQEKISRFIDGDVTGTEADALIRDVKSDQDMKAVWNNYHLIGDVLRSELPAEKHNLAERLSQRMEHEPVHFSPRRRKPQGERREWAGFAMAASITGVAMFGMLQMNTLSMTASVDTLSPAHISSIQAATADVVSDTGILAMQAETVDFAASQIESPVMQLAAAGEVIDMQAEQAAGDFESTMYDYLVNYTQYAVAAPVEDLDASMHVVGVFPH